MFQIDIFGDEVILTDEVWDAYVQTFQDCGYEIYFGFDSIYVPGPALPVEISDLKISIFSKLEGLRDLYYHLSEIKDSSCQQKQLESYDKMLAQFQSIRVTLKKADGSVKI